MEYNVVSQQYQISSHHACSFTFQRAAAVYHFNHTPSGLHSNSEFQFLEKLSYFVNKGTFSNLRH